MAVDQSNGRALPEGQVRDFKAPAKSFPGRRTDRGAATVAKFATVQQEGERQVSREIEFYNLDVIISVGYRVKSLRGTQFRIWATQRLREYLIKGFAMDDERLKQTGGRRATSRNCSRASATSARRKRCSGARCSTSTPPASTTTQTLTISQKFFATVQNKMHWAAHGHTAAEVDCRTRRRLKPNMGLTDVGVGVETEESGRRRGEELSLKEMNLRH